MTQSEAFKILKTGANVFLTGEPGSGKTHLVNQFVKYLRQMEVEPAITASTGIAATHINGMTIHSWSGIGIKNSLDKYELDNIASNKNIITRINRTNILIIDEVSMLSARTLSMVDSVCREIKRSSKPFGGIQIVLVGDFFQLPPIITNNREVQKENQSSLLEEKIGRFAFESDTWRSASPLICYLTEQHRQDDTDFLSVLSAIRQNSFGTDHIRHMENRKISEEKSPDDITKLFSHNVDVDRINNAKLLRLSGEIKEFEMSSEGPEKLVTSLKKGCLSPENLSLKIGASVMFTKNNPYGGGYVNGTLGKVLSFNKYNDFPLVEIKGGKKIEVEPVDWNIEEGGKIRAKITQLPLRLAWAITVHKSQGMSLDKAVMDLSEVFEFGQGYVALSRVRHLSGLFLLGWNNRSFKVHPQILITDKYFREASLEAEEAFSQMPELELEEMHKNFIRACGGNLESLSSKKFNDLETLSKTKSKKIKDEKGTLDQTLELWNKSKNISHIAKTRGLKETTILNHIEVLIASKKINKDDVMQLLSPKLIESLDKICDTFRRLETDKLSPVFEELKGEYSYDELRKARMML